MVDFTHRGESDIDIPVLVIALGVLDTERGETEREEEAGGCGQSKQGALHIGFGRGSLRSPPQWAGP